MYCKFKLTINPEGVGGAETHLSGPFIAWCPNMSLIFGE